MSGYFTVWLCVGVLSCCSLAAEACECTETDTPLTPLSARVNRVTQHTQCLLDCTAVTYTIKVQRQDQRTIRLQDSTQAVVGEYCWSQCVQCFIGERFQHALVVLPVDVSAAGRLQVVSTSPTAATLPPHSSPSTIADDCGLRYDVTQHFVTRSTGTSFCVRVVSLQDALGDIALKCPPYLVTFWQRSPDRSDLG